MALKALMLRKKINDKKAALDALRAKDADFKKREQELEALLNNVTLNRFSDLIRMTGLFLGTGTWIENGDYLLREKICFNIINLSFQIIFLFMTGNTTISNCNAVFRLYIYYLVELLIRIISIATYCSMMRMKFSIGIPIS